MKILFPIISVLTLSACAAHQPPTPSPEPALAAETTAPPSAALPEVKPAAPQPPVLAQVGRYSAILAQPTDAQRNPLHVMISVTLPRELFTIRQAVDYLLRRSGYRFADPFPDTGAIAGLLSKPLPEVHRRLGPMTLEDALLSLAGEPFQLVVDPVHRTVSYQLKPQWRPAPTLAIEDRNVGDESAAMTYPDDNTGLVIPVEVEQ